MSETAYKRLSTTLGILLTLSFLLGWLAQSVLAVGQDADYYLRSFQRYRVWESAGVSEADAASIAEAFPRFLSGDRQALSMEIEANGAVQPAFHEDELAHMQDVYGLFLLTERLLLCFAVCFTVLLALFLLWKRYFLLSRMWRAACWTVAGVAACCAALALWAAVDFTSLFTLFHRLFFQNDLWLMDPATDLMIRLMPQGMFADGALAIGLWFLAGLACYLLAAWAATHLPKRPKEAAKP